MESLDGTDWDVLIVGTGLQQSLLALALSRSGEKILHVDKNDYYGGSEAAFSLQEAEYWSRNVAEDGSPLSTFANVTLHRPEPSHVEAPRLSASRTYSLSLSPQVIYARSPILPALVSSKVYRQLEFLAVGAWWIYTSTDNADENSAESSQDATASSVRQGTLNKVPSGREDIFAAQDLDIRAKRSLMKFLRFIGEYEEQSEVWEGHRKAPFSSFLFEKFKVPAVLHGPLLALTLSSMDADHTTTEFALPRIARHLRSIGTFGPGFGSVIPRWGGLSEVCQVGCRAGAVGGAVYVLGHGLAGSATGRSVSEGASPERETAPEYIKVVLKEGEVVKSRWVAGSSEDLESLQKSRLHSAEGSSRPDIPQLCSRSITIISSPLQELFPSPAESAPSPAGAVVFFPSGSLSSLDESESQSTLSPVYIFIHSSDTGECPSNQSVLYASVSLTGEEGAGLLEKAVQSLLNSLKVQPRPTILWSLRYEQRSQAAQSPATSDTFPTSSPHERVLVFPPTSLDLALDDTILDQVKTVWRTIAGDQGGEFMVFEDREGAGAADADES